MKYCCEFPFDPTLFRDNPVVIDAGSRYGEFTRAFKEKYPTATIISIDPDILANKRLPSNVINIPKVLWYETGMKTIYFWNSPQNSIYSIPPSEKMPLCRKGKYVYKKKVETVTLEELIEKHDYIDLLKMNIEGAEWGLLRYTSKEILNNIGQMAIEVHTGYRKSFALDLFLKILDKKGFNAKKTQSYDWEQHRIYARKKSFGEIEL